MFQVVIFPLNEAHPSSLIIYIVFIKKNSSPNPMNKNLESKMDSVFVTRRAHKHYSSLSENLKKMLYSEFIKVRSHFTFAQPLLEPISQILWAQGPFRWVEPQQGKNQELVQISAKKGFQDQKGSDHEIQGLFSFFFTFAQFSFSRKTTVSRSSIEKFSRRTSERVLNSQRRSFLNC